jgi:hypothetical protein
MKLEGVIHCEGPDCDHRQHVGCPSMAMGRLPAGWLQVFEYGDQEPVTLAFCGWDCLMKRAAEVPPPEVIPWQEALGTDEEPG